jgi:hypothetical protein
MQAQANMIPVFGEAQERMRAAPPGRLFEALRLLAFEVACCYRHQEALPLPSLETPIKALRGRR